MHKTGKGTTIAAGRISGLIAALIFIMLATAKPALSAASKAAPEKSPAAVVEVNGVKFTRSQLDAEMSKKLALLKAQVPADRLQQMRPELRKQIIDDFVIRALLSGEVKKLKITATEEEVSEAVARVKSTLPPGITLEEMLKKNGLSSADFREEITLGVKINKLVVSQPAAKAKPTEKEIARYFKDNREKFTAPETVRARHILIAKNAGDDGKIKAEKRSKAEMLRKQLLQGADFAEVAAKNSDCPSKSSGGDLGVFSRGQMVKPFEDAAFSRKIGAVGGVVETDFGYHIIQVMERNEAKIINLDDKVKEDISAFLRQRKLQEAFEGMLKKLRAKAVIIMPGK